MASRQLSIRLGSPVVVFAAGALFALLVLEGSLWCAGFVIQTERELSNRRSLRQHGSYRIMCVGDSITAGGAGHSWPRQLEEVLNDHATGTAFSVVNRAIEGSDSSVTLAVLEDDLDEYGSQMVVAMMGANDVGGAIPDDGVPVVERTGGLYTFKTYKLIRLLALYSVQKSGGELAGKDGAGGSLDEAELRRPPEFDEEKFRDNEYGSLLAQASIDTWKGDTDRARDQLLAAIRLRPDAPNAYLDLAMMNWEDGRYLDLAPEASAEADAAFAEAEQLFEQVLEVGRGEIDCREALAYIYERNGEVDRAEALLRGTPLSEAPGHPIYGELDRALGEFLARHGRCSEALPYLDRAALHQLEAQIPLAFCLDQLGMAEDGWAVFEQALTRQMRKGTNTIGGPFRKLGELYDAQGQHHRTKEILERGRQMFPDNPTFAGRLARIHEQAGDQEQASMYRQEVQRMAERRSLLTEQSYDRMARILDRRGVRLVVAGYPRRSIEPATRLFDVRGDIILVDNGPIFDKALEAATYEELFSDECYGDFGHGTRKGNRLIAENVAQSILDALDLQPADD